MGYANAPGLRIELETPTRAVLALCLHGSVDLASIGCVCAQVAAGFDSPYRTVVVDLSMVDFLGVCGVRELRDASRRAQGVGATFRVVAGPSVHRTLRVTGVADEITVRSDMNEVVEESAAA